jgi:hypothetical protein
MSSSGSTADFNINIENYSFSELLNILSVQITPESQYEDIKEQIKLSTDNNIKIFQGLKKPEIVDFFNKVKNKLIGDNELSTNSQNILTYKNLYNPLADNVATSGDDMYNQNNGAGNPINRKTVSKLLNIDSRFRSNYLTTNSTNYLMDMPPINNVIEMTLCDLELPSTFYPISVSYQNNYFWVRTVDMNDVEKFYYIVVDEGNYYFQTLLDNINAIFSSDEISLHLSIISILNYNNIGGIGEGNGLTQFGVLTPDNIRDSTIKTFELKFNGPFIPGQNKSQLFTDETINGMPIQKFYYVENTIDYKQLFGWILGYRKPIYKEPTIDEIYSSMYYTSESIIDLSGPKYLYLIVNDFNNSVNVNFLTLSENGMLPDNIIARISQKGQLFSIQSQNDFGVYSEPRYYYGPVNINKLNIQLIDEYGRPIDLHYKDFSFTLRLTTIYSIT